MAERRFFRAGEYELFLDADIYDAFLNGVLDDCVSVIWYGWHRVYKSDRSSTCFNGRLFRSGGRVMLDLLLGRTGRAVVTLSVVRARDSISFVVKV